MATHFDVTPQTIRRDLNELCEGGQLHRVHGGAVFPTGAANYAYEQRRQISSDGKQRSALARRHSSRSEFGDPQYWHDDGAGGECSASARRDPRRDEQHQHGQHPPGSPNAEVIIAGGRVRRSDGGVIGEATMDFMRPVPGRLCGNRRLRHRSRRNRPRLRLSGGAGGAGDHAARAENDPRRRPHEVRAQSADPHRLMVTWMCFVTDEPPPPSW